MPLPAQREDDDAFRILVLGDSYSAGNGAGSYDKNAKGCYRSIKNYGGKLAEFLNADFPDQQTVVTTRACSGAVTQHFWHPQGNQPRQLSHVNHTYDTILLTVGGNDVDFVAIAKNCLIKISDHEKNCKKHLDAARSLIDSGEMQRRVQEVLHAIWKKAAPGTRIVLVGYPYLEANDGSPYVLGNVQVATRVRALGWTGRDAQAAAVDDLNARSDIPGNPFAFVPTTDLFGGRNDTVPDRCGLSENHASQFHELQADRVNRHRWMVAPFKDHLTDTDVFYHPNPMGWCQVGQSLRLSAKVPKAPLALTVSSQVTYTPRGSLYSNWSPIWGGVGPYTPEIIAGGSGLDWLTPRIVGDNWLVLEGTPPAQGTWVGTIRVTDDAGKFVDASFEVRVGPEPYCHNWVEQNTPTLVTAGGSVTWGDPPNYETWDKSHLATYTSTFHFGDGASHVANLSSGPVHHVYNNPGTYTVRIIGSGTLRNGNPCRDDATYTVIVKPSDTLWVNQGLNRGQYLQSSDGRYTLHMQAGDGNLVLYNSAGRAVWTTGKLGGHNLVLQGDSNLVVYRADGVPLWAANTVGRGVQRLVVQSDGNMVLYTPSGGAVWATNTAGR